MELVVVGAAGRTGKYIVARALDSGHRVTAFVRDATTLPLTHEHLSVVEGDVRDPGAVRAAVAGKDVVISVLGVRGRTTTTVFSDGTNNLVEAMKAAGVRRIVTVSTAGLDRSRLSPLQWFYATYVVERIMRNIYLDLERMEQELEISDTDWTVVRATPLTDGPPSGSYRAAIPNLARPRHISRADLAEYIVSHIDAPDTYQEKVMVSA